jgi:hypothetical protein
MWQVKKMAASVCKLALRGLLSAIMATLFIAVAPVSTAHAQISISINQPVCSYGYYDYAPYGCAPSGFYGPGYFYNGIFLGVGPWSNWGYGHGWGGHRFSGGGGGRYVGGHGSVRGHAYAANRGRGPVARGHVNAVHGTVHGNAVRSGHARPAHANISHGAVSRGGESHPAAHNEHH